MYKKLLLGLFASGMFLTGIASADDDANMKALGEKLRPLFGGLPESINKTPVEGIYEAVFGMELIYVSKDGRYFFSGDMIDGSTRTNLSETSRTGARKTEMAAMDASNTVSFKAKGEEKHVLSVFTDVTCPFCSKLHNEVAALNEQGVTVQYLAYPRAGVGSGSYQQMVNIWCAEDQQDAMTRSKSGERLEDKACDNPVASHFALGQKVGVSGTPALVTEDGTLIPGFRPAEQLVQMLSSADGHAAK